MHLYVLNKILVCFLMLSIVIIIDLSGKTVLYCRVLFNECCCSLTANKI
jgi:hypothetical protein